MRVLFFKLIIVVMKKLIFSLLTIFVVMLSCKNETEELNLDYGYEYFPIEVNRSVTYQVDTTFYDDFADTVYTVTSQVKEVIVAEDSTDLEGRPQVRIERYERADANTSWENIIPRVWYAVRSEMEAERIEENLRFLKLIFPVQNDRKWAGNAYIDTNDERWAYLDDWQYTYTEVGVAQTINGQSFDKTATVIQNDYCNLQQRLYGKEIYAEGVGLVYKELMNLQLEATSLPPKDTDPWPERANVGEHIVWQVISFE